jgi:DNA mismatch repair protein MutS2
MVLIDEIAVGTDPEQGAALGSAYLAELADRKCLCVVATHYERLKAMAMADDRFRNASMGIDWATLAPTYRLVAGTPGSSRTLEIARRFNAPVSVVKRAEEYLGGKGANLLENALGKLAAREQELTAALARAGELAREAEELVRRRQIALEQLGKQAERVVRKKVDEGMKEVQQALEVVARLVGDLQRRPADVETVGQGRKALAAALEKLREKREALEAEEAVREVRPLLGAKLEVGGEVLVKKFNRKGVVLSLHPEDRTAQVKMGAMHSRIPVADLVPLAGGGQRSATGCTLRRSGEEGGEQGGRRLAPQGKPGKVTAQTSGESTQRLDMRGMYSEEALALLEKVIDQAVLSGIPSITVVHGYGTGKLQAAVRSYLKSCPLPLRYRGGKREEGGDGVTIVELGEE